MKLIKDFENYRIHRNGKVESRYKPKTNIVWDRWTELKPVLDKGTGYYLVTLVNETGRYNKRIHRLLMEAFVPNPENKPQVNHIDGDKTNNCLSNLEWCTAKENSIHAVKNGLSDRAIEASKKKVDMYHEDKTTYIKTFSSMREASEETGIAHQNISKVCRGLRHTAGGYHWKYSKV